MSNKIWHRPILHSEREIKDDRSVTWLELFYDLVYVASLIILGNTLSEDISWGGVGRFVFLFIPIWWSWTGMTFYNNRFIVDDLLHRVLIFLQMFFVAAMAIAAVDAFGASSRQFALAYVAVRVILVILYLRAGRHNPKAQPLTRRYAAGFSLAALLWLISVFLPPPLRFVFWGIAIVVDFGTALSSAKINLLIPPDVEHMVERYGLFTIIVLGEAFVKVLSGASEETLGVYALLYGFLGMIIIGCLWWLYFDDIAGSEVLLQGKKPWAWIYSHLPVAIALAAYGVTLKKLVLTDPSHPFKDPYRLLLGGSLVIYLGFIALLETTVAKQRRAAPDRVRVGLRLGGALVILIVVSLGGSLPTPLLVATVALACLAPVVVDVRYRRQRPT